MSLHVEELSDEQAASIWQGFYNAYGAKVMEDAYGWTSAEDRTVQSGEHVWTFYDTIVPANKPVIPWDVCVGWGSLRLDLMDDSVARVAAGVFPWYQRKGYRTQILDWMTLWATERGIAYLLTETSLVNGPQIARKFRESMEGGPWQYHGTVTIPPPGYAVFARTIAENV